MRFARRLWPIVLLVLLVATGGVLVVRHDQILDWAATRGYQPSSQVRQLVTDDTMTPYAKRLFYANRPAVEDKQAFNAHCTNPSEQVAVLGCFTGNRLGIYLYNVTDPRLSGIEQVTAAHEMLHQAYQRLGGAEKTRINGLLQQYFDLHASPALRDKINSYKSTEPTELVNEMHSIFGTEVSDLPPALETYYKQYFSDRQQILKYHDQYQSEFDKHKAQLDDYDSQLADLKTKIDAAKVDLTAREHELQQRRAQLNAYLAANQIAQYNAAVPPFNALVVAYRAELNATNAMVDNFNTILAARNEIAIQERQLEAAIDSTVNTAPKQ